MVITAAAGLSSSLTVSLSKNQVYRLSNPLVNFRKHNVAFNCSANVPSMGNFPEPVKLMESFNFAREKLWQTIPGSLKTFPWKKLETVAVNKFLVLGKKTLKWSLLALYAVSFVSDIVYSISQNKELAIPFGLFAGSLIARYFDDISREFVKDFEDGRLAPQFVSISFFALVKIVAVYIFRGKDVLLHIANGGLMHALWNRRRL